MEEQNQEEEPLVTRQFAQVCEILERYEHDGTRLIPILQEVQDTYRYLPEEVLTFVATSLGISPARIFGVATFYSHFTLEPKGKYVVRICDGTACHVRNSIPILEALQKRLQLTDGRTTTVDMLFTLQTVSCLGACGLAPVMMVNDKVYGQMTPQKALDVIEQIYADEEDNNG